MHFARFGVRNVKEAVTALCTTRVSWPPFPVSSLGGFVKRIWIWGISACLSLSAITPLTAQVVRGAEKAAQQQQSVPMRPTGKGYGVPENRHLFQVVTGNGIDWHGGNVMHGTINVYFIWYGAWGTNSAKTILTNLAQHIGGSPYFNINTTYGDNNYNVSNSVHYAGSTNDNYSYGKNLNDSSIQAIVQRAISNRSLPKDTNGVYFVLTTRDVNETTGFCTQYCGWHTNGSISGSDIKFSFVGNPDRCPSACEAQSIGPNGNAGADGMASIIAHELEETATDPDLNAWWSDANGGENGDLCAWTFGSTYTTSNGAQANMNLGGRNYLIQQNWVNAYGGYCALSW